MSNTHNDVDPVTTGISQKGLSTGTVGLIGAVVVGISCIAPAYTFTAGVGGAATSVGTQLPAILLVGFIPMLLVAFGYRELNRVMPDSGTSFTWAARAFGPWVGWMAGWGLIAATVLVLSNLAGIAVDFLFLLIAQITGNSAIADLTQDPAINVAVCLVFVAVAAWISYRDMQTSQKLQYWLVGFQLLVLVAFSVTAIVRASQGDAYDATPFDWSWFNPFAVPDMMMIVAGLSVSIFMFWGWDVTLTMNEETKDPERTPGRAAALTIVSIIIVYLLLTIGMTMFAGMGEEGLGLKNEDISGNVFFYLSGEIFGPLAFLVSLAVLTSSASSLQSTMVGPARTLLAMGHYGALPKKYAQVTPRFFTPGYATIASAVAAGGFYAIMRFVSEDALWDTIAALGIMICFYYGVTAFACVWYFRRQWFDSVRNTFFTFLFPLIGGIMLLGLFILSMGEAWRGELGSDAEVLGMSLVFVLGMGVILLGVVIMVIQYFRAPDFFRGKTLGVYAPPSERASVRR